MASGLRKSNELLKKLLKDPDEEAVIMGSSSSSATSSSSSSSASASASHQLDHTYQEREDQLLKSLGFPTASPMAPIRKSPANGQSPPFNSPHLPSFTEFFPSFT